MRMFGIAETVGCPSAPLLEHERDLGSDALIANAPNPSRMHRTRTRPGLTPNDDPVDARRLYRRSPQHVGCDDRIERVMATAANRDFRHINRSKQRLQTQKPSFRRQVQQLPDVSIRLGLVHHRAACPDIAWRVALAPLMRHQVSGMAP